MADTNADFSMFDGRSVLITGGTGSFGRRFIETLLRESDVKRAIVFSRDELKQHDMQQSLGKIDRLRYFLGDVRDRERLYRAFDRVDIVVHAAALKQIPAAEYNPFEFVKTNIMGAQNIIDAAIDRKVSRVVALSTDKASSPINLYGATKLVSDKLFVNGNAYAGADGTRFSVVRYGNVVGSRGSVVPLLRDLAPGQRFRLTDARMTRFWITLERAVGFVAQAAHAMKGGEIFVPKLPSMKLTDLVDALAPTAEIETVGIRPGEKLHEEMISLDESRRTRDHGDYFVISPEIDWDGKGAAGGEAVEEGFCYASDTNPDWLGKDEMLALLDQ